MYEPLTWDDDEDITSDKLRQMAQNDQYLYENTVDMSYQPFGQPARTERLRIAAGVASIPPDETSQWLRRDIEFGNFFTPGTRPIVVATLATTNRARSMLTIAGPKMTDYHPTSAGFHVSIAHQEKVSLALTYNLVQFVNWIAIGY